MTSPDDRTDGAAPRHRSPLARAWGWVVDALAALGTALIAGLMLIICADIVARNGMGSSLPLVSELGALLLVMIVALQLAATVRADRLARAGLFITPMREKRPRVGAAFEALFCLAGAAMVGMMAWATLDVLGTDWERGEFIGTPGLGTLPTWPFRAFILVGLVVAAIEFLARAGRSATVAAGRAEPAS
ncbi:Tripartite ATP-independent periplasmic transporters, DctQ component [Roseivivax jejudonensis]|uniref:TRAP transporter small permease protein n=1 Tax=Roseivivax jejudonensis TaxID=1529041 RepID=A0A1X6ZVK7_9RHOB|nr:TRAP transporter small permease [Roseivivax jejudonensis]SLN62701.1 Tripartite ATP-independent periplasmic transporters, DctQ component [Roseivivax jejudonensis]